MEGRNQTVRGNITTNITRGSSNSSNLPTKPDTVSAETNSSGHTSHSFLNDNSDTHSSILSSNNTNHFDITISPTGEAIQLRATIEGLKEEVVSWSNAYKAMQKKHSTQIDRLIHEFNDRECKLKSQLSKDNTRAVYLMENELRSLVCLLKTTDLDELVSSLRQVAQNQSPSEILGTSYFKTLEELRSDLTIIFEHTKEECNNLEKNNAEMKRVIQQEKVNNQKMKEQMGTVDVDNQTTVQEYKNQITSLTKQIHDNESVYVGLKRELETVVRELEEQLRSDHMSRQFEREEFKRVISQLQAQISSSSVTENDYKSSFDQQMKSFTLRLRDSEDQKEKLVTQHEKEKKDLIISLQSMTELVTALKLSLAETTKKYENKKNRESQLSGEVAQLLSSIEQKTRENNTLREKLEFEVKKLSVQMKVQNDNLKKQLAESHVSMKGSECNELVNSLQQNITELTHKLQIANETNKTLDEAFKKIAEERNSLRYEVDVLTAKTKNSQDSISEVEKKFWIELEKSKEGMNHLSRKYRSVKEKYYRQSVRQNELQNYLLKLKKKKENRETDVNLPPEDSQSITEQLEYRINQVETPNDQISQATSSAPSSIVSSPPTTNVGSADHYGHILAKQLKEYKELQERYEKQRIAYEQDKENYDHQPQATLIQGALEGSMLTRKKREAGRVSDTPSSTVLQPVQQLRVMNKVTKEVHDIDLALQQMARSSNRPKKLRKKKPSCALFSQRPSSATATHTMSSNATHSSSRRHSIGGSQRTKKVDCKNSLK